VTVRYSWLGHAAARIEREDFVIYVDPFDLKPKKSPRADLVLLSNGLPGHASPEDLEFLVDDETVVAGPPGALRAVGREGRPLAANECIEAAGVEVLALPAFTDKTEFFPKSAGWLGYHLRFPEGSIHYSGMTDRLPREGLSADVAYLPVSGRYVMDPAGARESALALGAGKVLPLLVMGDRFYRTPGITTAPGEL
jgi:L-ascorbate metabolism protein UlaG (beta-lactamase superfamily)